MCRQVKFRIVNDDVGATDEILGGIGIYEEDKEGKRLVNVICGCCGGMFEPEEVEILEVYHSWADLMDTILET